MSQLPIRLVIKNYDFLAPLASGDIVAEDIALELDRATGMDRFWDDPSFDAGEISFSQYLIRRSQGEDRFVGLPLFPTRGFRHRCFFVRRGSPLGNLSDLAGKRVGTNGWLDTGNTWSRAALREAGVDIWGVDWTVGPVENPATGAGNRPAITLPTNVHPAPAGTSLVRLQLAGELDALMIPYPPAGFYEPDSPTMRLIPDYRAAERAYLKRVGFYPAHHLIALRRDVFERDPWVAQSLFRALETSRLRWQQERLLLAETTPWMLPEIEEAMALLGADWQPNGLAPNRPMIAALCDEEYAQRLVAQPIDPREPFALWEQAGGV